MRRNNARRRVLRRSTLESLENRIVMSADPLGSLLGGSIEHHLIDDIAVEHHSSVDLPDRTPDFWLDTTDYDLDDYLYEIEQTLSSANDLTGVTDVRADYGFDGAGQTVAIIDSGIAYDHYALGSGLGSDYRVVGGWDFTENDADPYDDGTEGSHGTHVSGIVGADSGTSSSSGVAPGVDLVGLRVFNDAGEGYFTWVEQALQWVHANRDAFENPITAVNLSLGTSWNSESIPSWAMLEDEFAQLEADGIFISVSAGNSYTSYNTPGLSYPAASSHVVPVMSVDDSGLLSYFSQRSSRAIAAPGRSIYSTVPDYVGNHNGVTDDWANFSGTSMAAPYVAGASVLIREAMEFVGYTDIDQWTIYDHMIDTADQFYDSATDAYYSRINVSAAIDALMPDDDFGSTIEDAYDLGTISDTGSLSGLIGKLDDVDYFTFTAGVTGTVSFSASATHSLIAAWTAVGADAILDGDTYTLDVVAGQSYSVSLATTDGLGYYDLEITAESTFTYTDLGLISQLRLDGISNNGESWYRVQAGSDGYLTAQALLAGATGDVDLFLYDQNLQPLLAAAATGDNDRVDALATAGDEFFLQVIGTAEDVEFQLTNLVAIDGTTVNITGTDGDDVFLLIADASLHSVTINGVDYQFDAAQATAFNFDGGAGDDTITLSGTAGNETATIRAGSATLVGDSFSAAATGTETITVYGGGGTDTANLYDSAGDDQFRATQLTSIMSGSGFTNFASGFANVYAYAINGGTDTAQLFDSAGDDVFTALPESATLVGDAFCFSVEQFESVEAKSTAGGNDRAYLYDSAGDDTLTARPNDVVLSGNGFQNTAINFAETYAYATAGGNDQACMYDSAGDDLYRTYADRVVMSGDGYFNWAGGFVSTFGYASAGNDQVRMYDSSGDDLYRTYDNRVVMSGDGYYNRATGFVCTVGYSTAGSDRALMYDSSGDDLYRTYDNRVVMSGDNYYNRADGFVSTIGYSTAGNDWAYMYDSAGDDLYRTYADRVVMSGDGFYNRADGFGHTIGYSTAGSDQALMYDSAGDDLYRTYANRVVMSGDAFYNRADGFVSTIGYSTSGNDRAYMYDSAGDDLYRSYDNRVVMSGDGYYNRASDFVWTIGYSTTGNDRARMYDSAGNDLCRMYADRVVMSGNGFYNNATGFKESAAYASDGYDHVRLYDSEGSDRLVARAWGAYLEGPGFRNEAYDFDAVTALATSGGLDVADVDTVDYVFELTGQWI